MSMSSDPSKQSFPDFENLNPDEVKDGICRMYDRTIEHQTRALRSNKMLESVLGKYPEVKEIVDKASETINKIISLNLQLKELEIELVDLGPELIEVTKKVIKNKKGGLQGDGPALSS